MGKLTIYHNPRCSKSRQTLALLRQHGEEPEVVLYMENTPNAAAIERLLKLLEMTPRQLLRRQEKVCGELGLSDPAVSDDQLLEAMAAEPRLIERPIVVSGKRAVIGRPPENVLELL